MNMKLKKKLHAKESNEIYYSIGKKNKDKTAKILCKKYGVSHTESIGRLVRDWIEVAEQEDLIFKQATTKKTNFGKKYYIITAVQNATPLNGKVWNNILAYSDYLGAELEVIPMRYKNPTSTFTDKQEKVEFWAEETKPFLIANRHLIHKNLEVIGDVKIQLTASTPLSGFEGLSGVESSIIGHSRQHFKTMPILDGQIHKFLISTGCVSLPNYTDSKVGKKGEFHHTYGFVIVEALSDNEFNFRHVSCDSNGDFYDLDTFVSDCKVNAKNGCIEAVILGDLHLGETCEDSLKCSYEMLERFNPKNVFIHDLIEGYSANPHDSKDPFVIAEKEAKGMLNISYEINDALKFTETILKYNPVIVKSNHDIFIDRYLLNDWRKTHAKNDYLKYAYLRSQGKLPNGILPYEMEQRFDNKVICLTENDSFKVKGVECGIHGHRGVSGTRGGIVQFKRLNTKTITAHSHSPQKEDGSTIVGTNTKLRMGYNQGLSTWCNGNAIIHSNGKVQSLLMFKGKYTTL